MPRRNITEHFEEERPEWTKRKHALLARYVVPAAMKMRQRTGAVALVDGYAGANAYGGEATGSTVIMAEAARGARATGATATVYACEPDRERYEAMCTNLATDVESGVLKAFNQPHALALPGVLAEIGDTPAIVFLDPHTVTQMTLTGDIMPWASRPNTDLLGVFMAGQACRCCAQLLSAGAKQQVLPEEYLGPHWREGVTEEGSFNSFFAALGEEKRFRGMYRLRKMEPLRFAYGIFGMSDHPDGFWLLSSAVAKDYSVLEDFDYRRVKDISLFAGADREDKQQRAFDLLVAFAGPTIRAHTELRGGALASFLFDHGIGVQELFGNYEERDFTTAVYQVLGLPDRRPHAKTKLD